jgi:hypothetical protein
LIGRDNFLVQYGRFLPGLVRRAVRASKPLVRSSVRLCDNPESLCGRPDVLCARPATCARVRAFCAAVRPLVRAEAHLCAPQTTCAEVWHGFCRKMAAVEAVAPGVAARKQCRRRYGRARTRSDARLPRLLAPRTRVPPLKLTPFEETTPAPIRGTVGRVPLPLKLTIPPLRTVPPRAG